MRRRDRVERISPAAAAVREGRTLYTTLEPVGKPETIPAFLARNASLFAGKPAYRERRAGRFVDATWDSLLLDAVALSRFLHEKGIVKGDRVATLSRNRSEMLVAEMAVMSMGAVYVPLFPGYTMEQTSHLIAHSGARVVLLSDATQLCKLATNHRCELIVAFEELEERERQERIGFHSTEFHSLSAVRQRTPVRDPRAAEVEAFLKSASRLDPGDPCLMMYTSGTAGDLKGVVLSHDNILSQQRALKSIWDLSSEDRFLS